MFKSFCRSVDCTPGESERAIGRNFMGCKVPSGVIPWANKRCARPRLCRVPGNRRYQAPTSLVPPTLRRRHPLCNRPTLARSPSSARPPRGARVWNGTGSNYGATIYPYGHRYNLFVAGPATATCGASVRRHASDSSATQAPSGPSIRVAQQWRPTALVVPALMEPGHGWMDDGAV